MVRRTDRMGLHNQDAAPQPERTNRRNFRHSPRHHRAQAGGPQIREQAMLLDKAQDAIFVLDLDERITFWNNSAERILRLDGGGSHRKNAGGLEVHGRRVAAA